MFNKDIEYTINTYNVKYELKDWIDINKINWTYLSDNPNDKALELLLKPENLDKIHWDNLSLNPNDKAIELLKENN